MGLLSTSEIDRLPITAYLKPFDLSPDAVLKLQDQCVSVELSHWAHAYTFIPSSLLKFPFLYCFVKMDSDSIHFMYLGKSASQKTNRLKQHLEGLAEVAKNKEKAPLESGFYSRFAERLTALPANCALYLFLFSWKQNKIISQIFPFPCEFSLDNSEAILIAKFGKDLTAALLNHEYLSRLRWESREHQISEINREIWLKIYGNTAAELWNSWIDSFFLRENPKFINPGLKTGLQRDIQESITLSHIPLFECDLNKVKTTLKGKKGAEDAFKILKRHPQMEQNVRDAVKAVEASYYSYIQPNGMKKSANVHEEGSNLNTPPFSDGLLYMAYVLKHDIQSYLKDPKSAEVQEKYQKILETIPPDIGIIPIYIGVTQMIGRNGTFSANLKGVAAGSNKNYFARWGDDDARHIGGLSLRFFRQPNNYKSTDYESWIEWMFDPAARDKSIPLLNIPVYYRMQPWFPFNLEFCGNIGYYAAEMETFLISLGRHLFPTILTNKNSR